MINARQRSGLFFTLIAGLVICGRPTLAQQRIEHLLQAADHLEKAGSLDLASQVRKLAAKEMQGDKEQLLAKKLAELQQLEAEVAQLRQLVGTLPQIAIHAQVLELDEERMQGGLGLVSFQSLLSDGEATAVVDEDGTLTGFLDFLKQQQMVKVLAEPSLITVSGRKASVVVGAAASSAEKSTNKGDGKPRGLQLDCTPVVNEEGGIEIALDLQLSSAAWDAASTKPASASRVSLKTTLEVQAGQTALLASPGKKEAGGSTGAVFVLLRAELVNPVQADVLPKGTLGE